MIEKHYLKEECLTCYGKGYDKKIFAFNGQILIAFKHKKDQFVCPDCKGSGYILVRGDGEE